METGRSRNWTVVLSPTDHADRIHKRPGPRYHPDRARVGRALCLDDLGGLSARTALADCLATAPRVASLAYHAKAAHPAIDSALHTHHTLSRPTRHARPGCSLSAELRPLDPARGALQSALTAG